MSQINATISSKFAGLKLKPVYMEVRNRDYDIEEPIVLVNADEIVAAVVSPGHPNGQKLLEDYARHVRELMEANPQMQLYEAKFEALRSLFEELYDIRYLADDDQGLESEPV